MRGEFGRPAKEIVPWNKGLTKETDERVKKYCESRIKFNLTKNQLYDLYWNKEMSLSEIAKQLGIRKSYVYEWITYYNISRRTNSEGRKLYFKTHEHHLKGTKMPLKQRKKLCKAWINRMNIYGLPSELIKNIKTKGCVPWNKNKPYYQIRGEKHPQWKGGITDVSDKIRKSRKFKSWVKSVFERDDYTCQNCKERGGRLNAHHIKAFSIIIEEKNITTSWDAMKCEELWDINNGITYCKKCHIKRHKKLLPSFLV